MQFLNYITSAELYNLWNVIDFFLTFCDETVFEGMLMKENPAGWAL